MLPSHKLCPICGKDFIHSKKLNKYQDLSDTKLSFIESICNISGDQKDAHIFRQLTSLYGELLCEQLNMPHYRFEIKINYIKTNTEIKLFKKTGAINGTPDKITCEKVIPIDYQNLDRLINRAKNIQVFL